MSSFLPIRPTERSFLIALLAASALSFLPFWRDIPFAGMSLLGWWMAALMVASPIGALIVFYSERKRKARSGGGDA